MNREVMSRQMFRNGGVVYMAGGGVVEDFAAVFASGDTNAFMDFFVEHEDELRDEARRTRNPSLVNMIKLIDKMESADADAAIAETQRMSQTPPAGRVEVPAPGGSAYIKNPIEELPFKGETPQPPIDLETFFQEYRQTPVTPPQPQQPQQPGMMGEVPMQYFQEGGMAMPAPMPAAPGPEGIASLPNKAAMEAMPVEGVANEASRVGLDPAVVQQMLGEVDSTLGDLENAGSYEDVINGIREADAPIEARYKELAGFVGEEDAMRTPESVLTMVQPVIMMAGIDQGIGALASEEMTAPVTGDMAGGIMSTVNMGQEGVPPVNFNLGGAVQYMEPGGVAGATPGGRLGQLYGEKRDVYRSIMGGGAQEEEYQKQKDLTEAQMLFDIAQGALAFAGGAGQPGRSPAEQLAAAASPVLGNIGTRAGELAKFKQAQTKEARAMDLAALTAAESALTAEKAAEDKEVGTPVKVQIFSETENGDRTLTQNYTDVLTRRDLNQLKKLHGPGNVVISAAPKAKSPSDPKPAKIVGPDGVSVYDFDLNNPNQYAVANKFLNDPRNVGHKLYTVGTEPSEKSKGTSYVVTIDGAQIPGLFDQAAVDKLIKDNPGKNVEVNTVPTLSTGLDNSDNRLLRNPKVLDALRNNRMTKTQEIAVRAAIANLTQERTIRTGQTQDGKDIFSFYKPSLEQINPIAAEAYASYLNLKKVAQEKPGSTSGAKLDLGPDEADNNASQAASQQVSTQTISSGAAQPGSSGATVQKTISTPGGGAVTTVIEPDKAKQNMDAFLDKALASINPDIQKRIDSLPKDFDMRSSYGVLGQFKELAQTPFDLVFGVSMFPLTNESQNVISELNNTMELVFSSETGLRDSVARMKAMRALLPDPSTAWRPRGPNNAASKIRALLPKINDSIRDMSEVLQSGNVPEAKRGEVMLNLKRLIVMNKAYSDFEKRLSSSQEGAAGSKIQQNRIYQRAKEAEERKRRQSQGSQ